MSSRSEAAEMETVQKTQKSNSTVINSDSSAEKNHSSEESSDIKSAATVQSFSKLLQGVVMAANSSSDDPSVGFQGQCRMSHQEALAIVTAKAAEAHPRMQLQAEPAKSLIRPPPMAQSEPSVAISSNVIQKEHKQSRPGKERVQEANTKNSSTPSSLVALPLSEEKANEPADDLTKTPKSDGYGWRKYGQKQVKSSGSSRSYYRCTLFSCHARKKVQHMDISGQIIEVVYKGNHNHDPPQNPNKGSGRKKSFSDSSVQKHEVLCPPKCGRELEQVVQPPLECQDGNLSSTAGTSEKDVKEHAKTPDATPIREQEPATLPGEAIHGRTGDSNELDMTDAMKDQNLVPLKKRRMKENDQACSHSVYRTFKEPKIVVHAAEHPATSIDGYRWRKYGQKMVKGNLHPRSYYRCSFAGCPVRKHVERAPDNSTATIATYEGEHNHDMPVPKKQHGSPKSSVGAVSSDPANNVPLVKSEPKSSLPAQGSPAPPSRALDSDIGGEKATSGAGGDKVLESARTLLSIGIELKSC